MINRKKSVLHRIIAAGVTTMLVVFGIASSASAGQITLRSVTLGSSVASASTTYAFSFTVPSSTVIQSVDFQACLTASGACTMPPGFSQASSTLTSQPTNLGDASGWTVSTATTGSLRLSKSGDVAAPTGAQSVSFSNVVNPSATNATFFIRMTTYSAANWTGAIHTGTVATSTGGQVTVNASVDEALTFTIGAQTVSLGTLSTTTSGTGTSTMSAATNAAHGYSITVNGSTLTNGSTPITALASQTASSQGTKQFGINLVHNTSPTSFGTTVGGIGSAAPTTNYNTTNQYRFGSGESVASYTLPTNNNDFTVSYLANIDSATSPGSYQTLLNYVATPNF